MANRIHEYVHECRACKHAWNAKHLNGDDAKNVKCPKCGSVHTTAEKIIFLDKAPDIEAAFDEAKNAFKYGDASEKVGSTAKLAAKSLFGAALFIGEFGASLAQGVVEDAPKLLDSETWKGFANSYSEISAKALATTIASGRSPDGSDLQSSTEEQRSHFESGLVFAKKRIETNIKEEKKKLVNLEEELRRASSKEEEDEIKIKINENGMSASDIQKKEDICKTIDLAIKRMKSIR